MTETCLSLSVSCSNSGFSRSCLACPKSLWAFAVSMEFCRGSKSWRLGTYQTWLWKVERGLGMATHASISRLAFSSVRSLRYLLENLAKVDLLGLKSTISSEGIWKIKRNERSSEIEVYRVEESGHGDILSDEFLKWRSGNVKSDSSPDPSVWNLSISET